MLKAVGIAVIVVMGCAVILVSKWPSTTSKDAGSPLVAATAPPAAPLGSAEPIAGLLPSSRWRYGTYTDAMGRQRTVAAVKSINSVDFSFPYQGSQHADLTLRRDHNGLNVILSIDRGQFMCDLSNCPLNVRFDEGPITAYSSGPPADHSTTHVFLNNEAGFVARLQRSKVVRIEASFYQQGSHVFEFPVAEFSWPK
jgi:hypothetical protein